ncbi:MAG TPA: ligase-associated DNA damage response exonuclease [Geminicoccaceae bacterium]
MTDLVTVTDRGLCCRPGGFHVDPWRPVDVAVITHAHGDHARPGSGRYHAAESGLGLLRRRLGDDAHLVGHAFGERFRLGEATVSFHPAGHVLGSAQVRIEAAGEVWVISGDYKRDADPSCEAFEVVSCDVFITEATFALPVYRWPATEFVVDELLSWWRDNSRAGRASIVFAYALGKAQRILTALAPHAGREILVHGAVDALLEPYREAGVPLAATRPVGPRTRGERFAGDLVVAPPSASGSPWMRRFGDASTAFASGWMRVRGNRRRRGVDRGFVMSDHADWPGLLRTIRETGARRILATHGYSDTLARYLLDQGLDAAPLGTLYEGETDDA